LAARDLTRGAIPVLLVQLALPVLAAFVLQSMYQLADLYFVGRLGGDAIAGLSISINTFFITLALGMTFGIGAVATLSQAFGAGRRAEIPVLFQQALWMALLAGSVMWLAAWLSAERFVAVFTDDPGVLAAGTTYFRIFSATMLTNLLLIVGSFSFRAVGDFITPTLLMGVGVVLNVGLDPMLIFGWGPFPPMGIAGAAVATVLTQALGVVLLGCMAVARRPGNVLALRRPFTWRPDLMARILRIGVPSGAQFLLFAATLMVTYRFVRPYGGEATAAVGVGFRVLESSLLPLVSVGAAISTLAGQNYGAGRYDRLRATTLYGIAYGAVITAAEFALLASMPAFWVGLFTADPTVRGIGAQYLSIVAVSLLMLGPGQAITNLGVGLGRTLLPLGGQLIRLTAFLGALGLLVGEWQLGLRGIFWSRALSLLPEMLFLCGVLGYWWVTVMRAPAAPQTAPARPAPAEAD
jgi:MATE family, multidrug efflux pump